MKLFSRTPASNSISLVKGGAPVTLTKTTRITATASWSSSTDYDLYAIIVGRDGSARYIANFGATGHPSNPTYRGVALGRDAGRDEGGRAEETLTIAFDDTIAAVIPVAYSAQSNGTGSFRRYQVSLRVDNGAGESVTIDAVNANANDTIYTCVPAIIHNAATGVVVEYLEAYSRPGSENRPIASLSGSGVRVTMDGGPRNDYK